ncbi:cytoplasmic protein [Kwoniella mangroviensis CBS 10435]|uniref:Cytoplasmic protein n=1 Tax=Kwoniella mangroviensis CBS 10435 TaxID=1331196 RepID=A0A1B9IPS3_9TREE|nr:cytoplasmic protein [Kwoniella mangroviensis CBS 10435]
MVTSILPRKRNRTLPVTTFLISIVLLSIVLPSLANASATPLVGSHALLGRHQGHDDDDVMDMDMDMGIMHGDDGEGSVDEEEEHTHAVMTSTSDIADSAPSSSSAVASTSTATSNPSHSHSDHPPSPHDHGSHTAPKEKLDDESVHRWHHFPPTYLDADFRLDNDTAIFGEEFDETWDPQEVSSHRGLMAIHALLYYGAYFGLLPISLALRAADHPSHYFANAIFLLVAVLGWLAGKAYKAGHENRYEGAVHEPLSNILLLLSVGLTAIDSLEIIKRCIKFYKQHDRSWSAFVHEVLSSHSKNEKSWPANRYEMVGLVGDEHDEDQEVNQVVFAVGDDDEDEEMHHHRVHHEHDEIGNLPTRTLSNSGKPRRPSLLIRQWTPPSRNSTGSEGTLHETPGASSSNNSFVTQKSKVLNTAGAYDAHAEDHHEHENGEEHDEEHHVQPIWSREKSTGAKRAAEIVLTWVRRSQIIFAYVVFLTEFVEYTGMCRAGLINSCAAHYIKGSIFFWYGVLTFARYLGAYADLGWAWNKRPGGAGVSAEMIECAVIFTYGITNTWMERFGSNPSDPYTVKQVQHISIAVMFWFAGLSGILLESRWVRKVMGSFISGGRRDVHEPPTYAFSYNPLPALVIGVTGLAMAAHHQEYVFQVSIHSLWGTLLAGGSLFRFLTYFFLFLRPPVESTLPSRPPTEVLTSFGYAAGGIVFMLSNEEIAWAAMRAGWDDMMAFLNFTIALTCLVFCWSVVVMALKGWAGLRMTRKRNNIAIA